MKMKTESGVSITIIPEGSSKVIVFSKPVRAIELKKSESSEISAVLSATTKEDYAACMHIFESKTREINQK